MNCLRRGPTWGDGMLRCIASGVITTLTCRPFRWDIGGGLTEIVGFVAGKSTGADPVVVHRRGRRI